MKKSFLIGALACLCAGFVSCSDDDGNETVAVETSSGIYVINGGNLSGNIPGSVTAYSYETGAATQNAFFAKNQQALGDTPEQALIYGTKMYISVYRSNVIWVVDPTDLKIIKSIQPTGDAKSPRGLAAKDGKVYASMYTGYVCKIDTVSLNIESTVAVGNNPDQIAIGGNNLYVANSDGSQSKLGYPESSVSIIDLGTFTERKINVGQNPTDMASNGRDVYVITKGNYDDNPSVVKKIEGETAREICRGTNFAIDENYLYVIDAPYSSPVDPTKFTYRKYNASTGADAGAFVQEGVDSPAAIDIDPVTGDILILSYSLDANNKSQYREPGYAQLYSRTGEKKQKFTVGVGQRSATFIHKTEYISK